MDKFVNDEVYDENKRNLIEENETKLMIKVNIVHKLTTKREM